MPNCIKTSQNSSTQGLLLSAWFQHRVTLSLFHTALAPPGSSGNATKWLGDGMNTSLKSIYLKGLWTLIYGEICFDNLRKIAGMAGTAWLLFHFSSMREIGEKKADFEQVLSPLSHLGSRHIVYTSHVGSLYIQWRRETPSTPLLWTLRAYAEGPLCDYWQSLPRKASFSLAVVCQKCCRKKKYSWQKDSL